VRINPRVFIGLSEAQFIGIGLMVLGTAAWFLSGPKGEADVAKEALRA